jgi:predicted acylesterase/phospholipase RssA
MKKVTLAIRGGGVKIPAIGVLQAFEENNIKVAQVSGTSIGAIIATLVAIEAPSDKIEYLVKKYVVDYSNATILRGGKGSKIIEDTVNKQCDFLKFKDVKKPLYIVANQGGLWNPRSFIFGRDITPEVTVGEACRASCSFPFLYERYGINISGKKIKFFDGGMAMNPYIPDNNDKGDTVSVLVTFQKNKDNMRSRYKNAWLIPEERADFLIKPYIGKMGSLGTSKDIELSRLLGYNETLKQMETLLRLLKK